MRLVRQRNCCWIVWRSH
jgi:hypothetical protein